MACQDRLRHEALATAAVAALDAARRGL